MDPSPAPTWGGGEPTGVPGGFPRGDAQEYLRPKNTLKRSVEQGGGAGVFYRQTVFLCNQKTYMPSHGHTFREVPARKYSQIVTLVSP